MQNFDDEGYDFYIAARPSDWNIQHLEEELEEDAQRFEKISVPEGRYLICETERSEYPTEQIESLRRRVVMEWLPTSAAQLLFYGVADPYCDANNVDITKEGNNDLGLVDFRLSRGSRDQG